MLICECGDGAVIFVDLHVRGIRIRFVDPYYNLMSLQDKIKTLQSLPEKHKIAIMVVVIVIATLIMGYFWVLDAIQSVGQIQDSLKSVELPNVEIPDKSEDIAKIKEMVNDVGQAIANESEMADWKTYANTEYGFEIKYPANFVEKNPPSPITFLYLGLKDDVKNEISFAQITIQKECVSGDLGVSEKMNINGINFDRYTINKSGNGIKQVGYTYRQEHDKCNYFSIEGFLQDSDLNPQWTDQQVEEIQNDFVKILSTLKFTNTTN